MDFKPIFRLTTGKFALLLIGILLSAIFIGSIGVLAFYIFIALWMYNLAVELYDLLPKGHTLNLFKFKLYFICMVASVGFGGYIIMLADLPFETLVKIIPFLNIIDLFFIIACILFISKELVLIKRNKTQVDMFDYIGMFISFTLVSFLLGVIFVQPVIKSIFDQHADDSEKDIKDIENEQNPETIINYTSHVYKCPEGELVIEQELNQPNFGEMVLLNGSPAPTGKYKIGFLQTLIVVDGKVANRLPETSIVEKLSPPIEEPKNAFIKHTYNTDQGELVIEQEYHVPNKGEFAYLNGEPAPTGKYKIGFLQSIYIIDGIVSEE